MPLSMIISRLPSHCSEIMVVLVPLLIALLPCASGYAYDVLLPGHLQLECDCKPWADMAKLVPIVGRLWGSAAKMAEAGTSCAIPANAATPDPYHGPPGYPDSLNRYSALDGYCLCGMAPANSTVPYTYTHCAPPRVNPSQINLLPDGS